MTRKSGNIFRTTISVPQELKARMDKVGDGVNWSAVACRAFEQKLAEITAVGAGQSFDAILQRLRATKRKREDVDYEAGERDGFRWVDQQAEVAELERLEGWRRDCGRQWDLVFDSDAGGPYGVHELFYFVIRPAEEGNRAAAESFWKTLLVDDARCRVTNSSYMRGFVEGALGRWAGLKDQL